MQFTFGMRKLNLTDGMPLSIIDRAWLSGFPAHAEVERVRHKGSGLPREESEFFYGIAECFHEDDGGLISLRSEKSLRKLAENDYYFEIIDEDGDFYNEGIRIRISKSNIERTFLYDRTKEQFQFHHSYCGKYLEEFVVASLWHAWDPVSTAHSMSLIDNTVEERRRKFHYYVSKFEDGWKKNIGVISRDRNAWYWEDLCKKHGLDPNEQSERGREGITELTDMELARLSDCDEESRLWWLRYQRTTEIDVVLLDKMGITTFDSKGKMDVDSGVDSPDGPETKRKANKQSPDWLVHQKFFTIHSSYSSGQSKFLPWRIHMERMWLGRRVFDGDILSISSPLNHYRCESKGAKDAIRKRKKAERDDARRTREASGTQQLFREGLIERVEEAIRDEYPNFYYEGVPWGKLVRVISSTLTLAEIHVDLGVKSKKNWEEWEKILPHSHVTLWKGEILVIGIRK